MFSSQSADRSSPVDAPESSPVDAPEGPAPGPIAAFYEEFADHFLEDVVVGNERVREQIRFFSRAIPASARSILIVGCGAGQAAHAIATRIAPKSRVLALDLSAQALRVAHSLFSHPNIEYRRGDAFDAVPEQGWEVVVLPDVFEHIPAVRRTEFAALLRGWLADRSRILLTIPTIGKQESLRRSGKGLQVVDEDVSLHDLNRLADEVEGMVTYYAMMSIWETNDYAHAQIERGIGPISPLGPADRVDLKGWPRVPLGRHIVRALSRRLRLDTAAEKLRRLWLSRKVGRTRQT